MTALRIAWIMMVACIPFVGLDASATDLFVSTISVAGQGSQSRGTHEIREVSSLFESESIRDLFPGYQGTEQVANIIELRGVNGALSFAQNSSDLRVQIPAAGIDTVIPGIPGDRDTTLAILNAWLKGDIVLPGTGGGSITPVLQAFVRDSPVDPVAGNPNSLQSKMFAADFDVATSSPFLDPQTGEPEAMRKLRLDAAYSYFRGGPYGGHAWDLAAGYRWDPQRRLSLNLDVPVAITSSERGLSFMASAAGIATFHATPHWNLSGGMRMGFAGSFDLGALALLYQGSVASQLQTKVRGFDLRMGNLIGLGSDVDGVKYGSTPVSYDLLTGVFRNGVDVGRALPGRFGGHPLTGRVYYVLTNYVGTDLYLQNQHDVGLEFTPTESVDRVRFRIGWVGGRDYSSLQTSLVGRF